MVEYILMVMLVKGTTGSLAFSMQEFNSKARCENAKSVIKGNNIRKYQLLCVPK